MLVPVIQPPADGFTGEEKLFIRDIFINMYEALADPTLKFMIIAYFECGYSQDEIAIMTNMSQPTVAIRIDKACNKLRRMRSYGKI